MSRETKRAFEIGSARVSGWSESWEFWLPHLDDVVGSGKADGAGRLDWLWQNGLDRARWIAGSGLVLAELSGSGRMDWPGAR